jgi:peptidoglycan hydrolase-like protein with peptidoglycan-binding domain
MSWTIPAETKYSHQKRSKGIVVFAIQRALNDVMAAGLSEDGHYGSRTEGWAATFQEDHNLYADGIFGPASSQQMARNLEALVTVVLPERLIEGFVEGESGGHIGAVNW